MKIIEHFLETKSGQSKIILDLQPNICIVYVTSHGIQVQEPFGAEALTLEQARPIFEFIQSYLDTISEDKPILHEEQSRIPNASQETNPHGKVTQSTSQADSKPNGQAEGCGEGEALGSEVVKDS